jgi:nucleotidyltransferase/DNA polymerase involved in DNA repair
MLIARLATRHAKPNGQFLVKRVDVGEFMKVEKIENLPGLLDITSLVENYFQASVIV